MSDKEKNMLFSFFVGKLNIALPIDYVLKALPLVELKYLPNLPESILGLLNYQGEIYPVFDLRKQYGDDDTSIAIENSIIIGNKEGFKFGILATKIVGNILKPDKKTSESSEFNNKISLSSRYVQYKDNLICLSDPAEFLMEKDKHLLSNILKEHND